MIKVNDSIVTPHIDIFPNGCTIEFPNKLGWVIYEFNNEHKITSKEYYEI